MLLPVAPDHMYLLRNQTVTKFGYDDENNTDYCFNSLGYRSNLEFDDCDSPIIILGNTISFGLGLQIEQSFAGIIANTLKCKVYNFSWGCYGHTNADQLLLLKQILTAMTPRLVIFQINNLNRFRIDNYVNFQNSDNVVISEFNRFNLEIQQVLNSIPHDFLYWDETSYPVDLPECLIHNRYHVDSSLKSNKTTFGPKSHKLIAYSILKRNI
jgi:hypothetical protein